MDSATLEELISLRRKLHSFPEISGEESHTAEMVVDFIKQYNPHGIIRNIGGAGVAFIYDGDLDGDTLLLRADLDALPIQEKNNLSYKSNVKGVSHKCGHDGHMAIIAGVATQLKRRKLRKGKLILLYQPAEETGEGAKNVIEDEKFAKIRPDYVFALHNLPGYPEHSIAIKDKYMTIASTGMKISLIGKAAHAMSPEDGISPVEAIKTIHTQLNDLQNVDRKSDDFSLITTVGIMIGAEDYGVAPADGELVLTVRAYKNEILESLLQKITSLAGKIAQEEELQINISYKDQFLVTVNDTKCVEIVKDAALSNQLDFITLDQCLGSSEDFGRLIDVSKKNGALFLLGAGEKRHNVHTPEYDFNDNILIDGINMFYSIIDTILGFQADNNGGVKLS